MSHVLEGSSEPSSEIVPENEFLFLVTCVTPPRMSPKKKTPFVTLTLYNTKYDIVGGSVFGDAFARASRLRVGEHIIAVGNQVNSLKNYFKNF